MKPEGVDGYCGCGCLGNLDIVYDDADLDAAVAVNVEPEACATTLERPSWSVRLGHVT